MSIVDALLLLVSVEWLLFTQPFTYCRSDLGDPEESSMFLQALYVNVNDCFSGVRCRKAICWGVDWVGLCPAGCSSCPKETIFSSSLSSLDFLDGYLDTK